MGNRFTMTTRVNRTTLRPSDRPTQCRKMRKALTKGEVKLWNWNCVTIESDAACTSASRWPSTRTSWISSAITAKLIVEVDGSNMA